MEDEIVMDAAEMILGQSDGFENMNCKFVDKFKDFVCAFFFQMNSKSKFRLLFLSKEI